MVRHLLLICLVTAAVFANSLTNGFHLDDDYRVLDNPGIQRFWPPTRHFVDPTTMATVPRLRQYRPLLPLTLSIDHAIAGDSRVGYHVGNLLLQILASVAVFFLVRELLARASPPRAPPALPLLVALAFAIHPVSGILVNYVSGRDLLLMQLFLVLSLVAYARMRRLGDTPLRWAAVLVLLLLSLLSKKNAAVAPLLVVAFEAFLVREESPRRFLRALPFLAVVLGVFAFIRFGLGFVETGNVVQEGGHATYALAQLQHHVFHYLRNFVWPFPIRQLPHDAVSAPFQVAGALVIAGAWFAAWRVRRTAPLVTFCVAAYSVLLLPSSSIAPFHAQIVAYRPYPSSVYLFLLAGLGIARLPARIGLALGAGLLAFFAGTSFVLNRDWRTSESLFRHAIAHGGSATAYCELAIKLEDAESPEKLDLLRRAIELQPDHIFAHVTLGLELARAGRCAEGLPLLERGVLLAPERADSHDYLAQARMRCDDAAGAADAAAKAAELDPTSPRYPVLAGYTALKAGKPRRALRFLEPVVRNHPGTEWAARAHRYLARIYEGLGEREKAQRHRAAAGSARGSN